MTYKNYQQAYNALKKIKSNKDIVWQDLSSTVCFSKKPTGWCWEITSGIFEKQTHKQREELFKTIGITQTHGFKTRKNAIDCANILVGANTIWKVDLSKLTSSNSGVWHLPETKFRFFHLDNSWIVQGIPPKQFQTRKQALQYLFGEGLL